MPMSWLVTMLMSSLLTMLMFSLLTMQMSWLQTQQMSWLQTSMWLPKKAASGAFSGKNDDIWQKGLHFNGVCNF